MPALPHLIKLSLAYHSAAQLYLQPTFRFGALPSALRRWRQIKNLKLSIDSWPFHNAPKDHLKLLANYLCVFAGRVEKVTFHWYGRRGPCPLTMPVSTSRPSSPNHSANLSPTASNSTSQNFFAGITSPMSPLPLAPALHFQKVRIVQARNTHAISHQISSFITRHAGTIEGMNFENVVFVTGTWDDALLPLGGLSSMEGIWKALHSSSFTGTEVDFLSCGSSLSTSTAEE